jgi:hypothetical protein
MRQSKSGMMNFGDDYLLTDKEFDLLKEVFNEKN